MTVQTERALVPVPKKRPRVLQRPPTEREQIACAIEERLHGPIVIASALFVVVILGLLIARPSSVLHLVFFVASWVIWALFVFEFCVRMVIAPSTAKFLREKWWQIPMLAVPFLGLFRLASIVRLGRAARVLSSSVRATRTAGSALRARLYWLASIHSVVVLSSAELLVEYGPRHLPLLTAIHGTALAATTGQPLGMHSAFARALEVPLAIYAVAFFAAVAGALGAFFLERRRDDERAVADGATSSRRPETTGPA